MAEQPAFTRKQYQFAAYIRNPEKNVAPEDVDEKRMKVYRELFFNNSESFISSNFPVLRKLFSEEAWLAMVQDFFENHYNQTPYFPEIPKEFLSYLEQEREARESDLPFMLELAHYEWAETAVATEQDDAPEDSPKLQRDPLNQKISLSPVAWPLSYHFPVHKISPDFQPDTAPENPTFLVVYRDLDDEVRFMEINAITFRLLQLLEEQPGKPAKDYLARIAEELNHPNPEAVIKNGCDLLRDLSSRNLIVTG